MVFEAACEMKQKAHSMIETFQILQYRNSDNLHLRLTGTFDEEAALALMEALNENRASVQKIFVHTAALEQVLDSGAELFRGNLRSLDRPGAEIIFTGKKGEEIAVKAPGIQFMR
jgi:anti-anti-sigma regulatory factor